MARSRRREKWPAHVDTAEDGPHALTELAETSVTVEPGPPPAAATAPPTRPMANPRLRPAKNPPQLALRSTAPADEGTLDGPDLDDDALPGSQVRRVSRPMDVGAGPCAIDAGAASAQQKAAATATARARISCVPC